VVDEKEVRYEEEYEEEKKLADKVLAVLCALLLAGGLTLTAVAPASAAEISINWTEIGGIIEGAGSIMPSIGSLIVAVVPIMLVLMVLGFVTGLFQSILDAIKSGFKF